MTDHRGPYIQTYTGRRFFLLTPRPEDVHLEDLAHALSQICRFGGHTRWHYSVAQHSVLVANLLPQELALHGLLHDAAEAYTGDVVEPLKRAIREQSPTLRGIEMAADEAVRRRFGLRVLTGAQHELVKHADLVALATERRDLLVETDDHWPILQGIEPDEEQLVPWTAAAAETVFLDTFASLTKGAA